LSFADRSADVDLIAPPGAEMTAADTTPSKHSVVERIIPEPDPATRPKLVVVTCAGRSESKWMLRLMDFHPQTLCRNEPDRMTPAIKDASVSDWAEWEHLGMSIGPRIGFVDRPPAMPKDYMRGWVKATRADKLLYAHRFQKLTGRYPEGRHPGLFYNAERIAEAQRVLKLINARHLVCRLLTETDHIPIIHMVRHPGGMLNSWLNRFAPTKGESDLINTQRQILRRIHESDPAYERITGPTDSLDLAELKLWSWRHAQDSILRLGAAHPRYISIVFEQLSSNALELMAPVYAMCGLEYTDAMRELIRAETSRSKDIAGAWKDRLPREYVELVERVLESSLVGRIL